MPGDVRATYRVQLNAGFAFDDAAGVTGYLARLGISHVYCSPYLQAAAGSTHGYDVTDHSKVNDELGGAPAHERFCDALGDAGLGHVLDVVPNHMAISDASNRWWWDVLRHGPDSKFAGYFDIDWDPPEAVLHRTILVPILGDHYGRILEAGQLKLARDDDGETVLRYHEHELPIAPGTVASDDLDAINGDPDALHEILERQHYRIAFWRAGDRDLNYRRFFDIKTLAALRIEDERVFDDTHRLVLSLIHRGKLDGLRIDHVDGLRDPAAYLETLRARAPETYLVVEKILEAGEELPDRWPVEGTTGYDFLNVVNGLFVDSAAEKAMSDVYLDFTREPVDLAEMIRAKKLFIMREVLVSDVERLTALLMEVSERHRRYRDCTRHELREAIRETIAAFPVYRTYLDTRTGAPSPQDVAYVEEAIEEAAARRPDLAPELFEFLCNVLLMRFRGSAEDRFVLRFQQTTGPVMAKGVEDTVFYNFNRLVSLNEVGGDLGCFGISLEAFHDRAARAQERWPLAMLATSTHDTKRSEDVRARIDLLSEIPARWGDAVARWKELNDRHRSGGIPDRNAEYLLYQTLVGAWPLPADRAVAYMEKVSKEAKAHTSWTEPAPDYDEGLAAFVRAILDDRDFVAEVEDFVAPLVEPGRVNSLAQTAFKLTYPGVPDVYQGSELWDLSLVDPDNRRPVDYALRARLLEDAITGNGAAALQRIDEGLPKLFLIQRVLALRARDPGAFGRESSYEALWATGPKARHAVAFVRGGRVLTVAPRLALTLEGEWRDTHLSLPDGDWTDSLTGRTFAGVVPLEELLSGFPVLVAERGR